MQKLMFLKKISERNVIFDLTPAPTPSPTPSPSPSLIKKRIGSWALLT